ncbi:cytochrome c biogenesis protein CcdC [Planomicrobium chinense]|uniref:CcdC family protein n=1 Tax=Planococcus chinensis TaxID=272917 RepID=UPI001CC4C88A|nr:cytochrome c biogenesis protein CcdC [Planococcus chinensis]MBZ5201401.1 cytochrome c biogenesis protein CcdC [Planococcus chinensis]MCP2034879.1 membrane protein CcdC involved in cytochrome C biogenesis [Planomicrobium sp. HSC-17F08]
MFEFLEMVPPWIMLVVTTVGALGMGIMAMIVRSKSAKKPASAKKIILPPLFMSTGALMFVFPFFRVAPIQIGEALLVGVLFSTVLIWSSKFEVRDGDIYLKQSKAFVFILIGLLLIRVIGKVVLSSTIDVGELGGMFWILAFGMIVPWRLAMYMQYRKLQGKMESAVPN